MPGRKKSSAVTSSNVTKEKSFGVPSPTAYKLLSAASPVTPLVANSAVGLVTYTPATGTFHVDLILRFNGTNLHNLRDGTYTVDATGHGTMMWLSGSGDVRQIDFYIVNGGAELKWIITDPSETGELSTFGTMTKQ